MCVDAMLILVLVLKLFTKFMKGVDSMRLWRQFWQTDGCRYEMLLERCNNYGRVLHTA